MSSLFGLVRASEAKHFRARPASDDPSQAGLGDWNSSCAKARISDSGACLQFDEVELDRSKIPGKARWAMSWIEELSSPSFLLA